MSPVEFSPHDEMIDRAVVAGSKADTRCPDGTPCTHTDCHYRGILEAAFEGVPMANYAIGLLLQHFELVICARADDPLQPQVGVFRRGDDPDGFEKLGHKLELNWGHEPRSYIKRVAVGGIDAPAPLNQERTR